KEPVWAVSVAAVAGSSRSAALVTLCRGKWNTTESTPLVSWPLIRDAGDLLSEVRQTVSERCRRQTNRRWLPRSLFPPQLKWSDRAFSPTPVTPVTPEAVRARRVSRAALRRGELSVPPHKRMLL
ncbi:unnamed protein product, partial [Arctogadus glacialis]